MSLKDKAPKDENVRLLLCEDVRPELNGKVTLAGFFPGLSIRVPAVGPSVWIQLAFLFVIEAEPGRYTGSVEMRDADGISLFRADTQAEIGEGDDGTLIVVKVIQFPVTKTGEYGIELNLSGTSYPRKFKVQLQFLS